MAISGDNKVKYLSDFEKYLLTLEDWVAVRCIVHLLENGNIDSDAWTFMYAYHGVNWKNDHTKYKALAELAIDKLKIKNLAIQKEAILATKQSGSMAEYDLCSRCKEHTEFNLGISTCCEAPAYDPTYNSKQTRTM